MTKPRTQLNEQFDTVIVNTALGDTKEITFPCSLDCEGETLIGKIYVIGSGNVAVKTVTGGSDKGKAKNKLVTLTIDISGVDDGIYGLKIYTAETGVIAKAICVIR